MREEKPLSIVARIDGELRMFSQSFEVDAKKPGGGRYLPEISSGGSMGSDTRTID